MSKYIAVLDREHLENKIFLNSFAKSLASHGNRKGIIIHGDSEYTERLIQTGMMRKDARERAVKDLNRRLVGLLADQGVPAIGVNGYQKELVQQSGDDLQLDTEQLHNLPPTPCVLISSLVEHDGEVRYAHLSEFASLFRSSLEDHQVVLFSKNEKDEILISNKNKEVSWSELDEDTMENALPQEFKNHNKPVILTSATDFANWPDLKNQTQIH